MTILSIQSISKSYNGNIQAVNNVSFDLNEGEILAVIGQSGSGKTTLIKMVAGLVQPDEGRILFHGKPLEGPEEKLVPGHKEIRLVHQDFKLHHQMTVAENLNNALLEYVAAYRKERTTELLDLCYITQIQDQYVHKISGGEKQRVAIAMALSTEPEVLLFDEPFSNLDLISKSALLQEVATIAEKTGTAMILVTHDSRDALEVANRMVVMRNGQIAQEGTPQGIYQQPAYAHVADLIGFYNRISLEKLLELVPGFDASNNVSFGIWAEDISLRHGNLTGTITQVIFGGPYHKVQIRSGKICLWAYDFLKTLSSGDEVPFTIRHERVFPIKKA